MLLSRTKTIVIACLLLCVTGIMPLPFQKAQAQTRKCWTVAASVGSVDESARDFISLGAPANLAATPLKDQKLSKDSDREGAIIALTPMAPKGTYVVRYHVTSDPGLFCCDDLQLRVRYLVDDKKAGRVVVILKKYNLESPLEERAKIIAVFDSKDHPAAPAFQLQKIVFKEDLDFFQNAYFVEVQLINDREPPIPTFECTTKLCGPALAAISLCGAYIVE